MRKIFLSFFLIAIAFYSCQQEEKRCVIAPEINIEVNFLPLEDSIPSIKTKQQLVDFFSRHVALRDLIFARQSYPSDSAFINQLFQRFTHPSFDTLLIETKKVFGNGESLKEEFRQAFANMKYYYPGFTLPKIETVITGLESDLFVSDTLIIIGLDYYLGKKARYRPNMHEYMLRRYEKNFIVTSALLLYGIDSRYNSIDMNDRTMLAEMIAYGKAYYFAKQMMPCIPDSVFIGYTQKEIDGAKANQETIWKRLVEDEALFSTAQQMKQRFIKERPKTFEVGNECPGRIGTWVGWQMVNEYSRRNPKISLPDLMQTSEAQKIFRGSKYNALIDK
ncbi:MAG: gliding motility lipoprotein GldB [Bacteroidetes bacterium]|nr:gliding motility lipoprotein GldB [Bacteroidota bacterium]